MAGERRRADCGDRAAADADMAHGIETRCRIHHPAAGKHDVELAHRLVGREADDTSGKRGNANDCVDGQPAAHRAAT